MLPAVNIPGPLPIPIPGTGGGSIIDNLNPLTWIKDMLGWINQQIENVFDSFMQQVSQLLAGNFNPLGGSWEQFLQNNVINLAGGLSFVVMIIVTGVAMFRHKRLRSVPHAFLVMLLIGLFGASWYSMCAWAMQVGNELSQIVNDIFKSAPGGGGSQNLFTAPVIDNPVAAAGGLTALAMIAGVTVVIIVYGYALIGIVFTHVGLLSVAISGMGERAQRFLDLMIALGGASLVFGHPLAVLCVGFARIFANGETSSGGWIAQLFWDAGGLLIALFMQGVLIVSLYRAHIASRISSGVLAARVWGNVTSRVTGKPKVDVDTMKQAHIRNKQDPIPVAPVRPSLTKRAVRAAGHEAAMAGATALGIEIAAGSTPLTAIALHGGKRVYSHLRSQRNQTRTTSAQGSGRP